MMKKGFCILACLTVFVCVVAPNASPQDSIKVGIILPLTGAQAAFGEIEKNSFEMGIEEVNAAGGIRGKKLEFIYGDDAGNPEVARSVAEKLIKTDKVVMLSGGYGSSETVITTEVAQQNKMPFLVNTAAADKITERRWEYVFRLNPPASDYPEGLESFLFEVVKPKTAAILFVDNEFGNSSAKSFDVTCQRLDIEVVMKEGYPMGEMDFKALLTKLKQANPELVLMTSYIKDGTLLMNQAMGLGVTPKLFVGGGAGFTLPDFQSAIPKAANLVFSTTLWYQTLPYPGANEYYDKYLKMFGKETEYHGAEAYAAVYVIADVLERTKSLSAEDVRQALAETNMKTVFGPVKFESFWGMLNQNKVPTYVVQWIDGKLELVWPKEVASRNYVYPIDWEKNWK
jgi:branched-chain amino acid transport system substrate-binding protein